MTWKSIDAFIQQGVTDGVFPAAELLVAHRGEIRHRGHYGTATAGVLFDIASLTKPIATATRAMQLAAQHHLNIDHPVSEFLRAAQNTECAAVTLRQLLNHTAGLVAWRPFFQMISTGDIGTPAACSQISSLALNEPFEYHAGTRGRYSDLGYIVLAAVLEKFDGRTLEAQFQKEIASPLGLTDTLYQPLPQSGRPPHTHSGTCAPTEQCEWRNCIVEGVVHDQNCYAMGGVSGHAGLFSTALDIHTFFYQFASCLRGHSDWIHPETIATFLDRRHIGAVADASHLCGWDTPGASRSQAGHFFSANAIGHLGYTGCSIWADLESDWWMIFLTNRIHPSTKNEKIKTFRPQLHDAVAQLILTNPQS
jgi:serine-type D-Ala-D-Ala carboxypeptidase